jgi:enoyl-CoA hydratase
VTVETLLLDWPVPQVALVTLNRPERLNAITVAMYDELDDTVARLAADRSTRVVVLTGAGRGFCAGQDLKDLGADPSSSELGPVQYGLDWQSRVSETVRRIHRMPQPVIAAVNGPASGAGLSIALAADTRVASRSARFNAAFVRIGLSGCDMGTSYFLPRIVGPTAATELMYTGRLVDADEALRIGLVLRIVDDGTVVDEAVAIAEAILANSPFGVAMTKQVLWQNIDASSLDAAMALENRTQILASMTEDAREAERAFLGKRAPEFHDR